MSLTVATLRQRVAARVVALGAPWKESPYLYELVGRDPASIAHGAFAVGVPRTTADGSRQRVNVGANVATPFVLRFTARVKPKDGVDSLDVALDLEHALIRQLCQHDATWPVDAHVLYVNTDRTLVDAGDWLRLDLIFNALHTLALQ